ncbi:MAG: lipocalin-like domain-containing protein [Dehalococcoidia bacterium]|jgi:hypothetical protein
MMDEKPTMKAIFTPSDADDSLHETAGIIYEWWYLDAAFDNGYSMSAAWQIVDPSFIGGDEENTHLVMFAIYDPSGKKTSVDVPFAVRDVAASKTSCDVTMGTNHLKGNISRYDMEFRDKDLGCKLIFESVTEAFRSPPDGVSYFTRQPDRWIGWVVALPRAKVTGTLIFNGKEIPVKGAGYHDHNWGNVALTAMYNYWYWGRIYLPDYTFIYSVGEMTDALRNKPISVILVYKGEKLVDVTTDITAEGSDFVTDKLTGAQYPQTLVLRPEGSVLKGTITHKLNHLLEGLSPWGAKGGGGHAYFRFLSDCDIKLNVAGDKIDVKTPLIHEYMRP